MAESCTPGSTEPDVDAAGRYYIDADCLGCDEFLFMSGVWVYEEANGIPGLQRQDEIKDDTCGGEIAGDEIVF